MFSLHALRQLRQIRCSVSASTLQPCISACPAGLGNSVLDGLPNYLMRRLQSVQHAAARLIFNLKRSDHITDALISLHWLRIPERIRYKVAVLTYKVLHAWECSAVPWTTRSRR